MQPLQMAQQRADHRDRRLRPPGTRGRARGRAPAASPSAAASTASSSDSAALSAIDERAHRRARPGRHRRHKAPAFRARRGSAAGRRRDARPETRPASRLIAMRCAAKVSRITAARSRGAVGIAADRGGVRRIVEGAAQRRAAGRSPASTTTSASPGVLGEKAGEQRRQRIAGVAHPDDAAGRPSG